MTRNALILLIGACPAVIVGMVWLASAMRDERAPAAQSAPPPRRRTWPRAVLRSLLLGLAGLLGVFSRIGHLIAALGRGSVALLAASARAAGRGAAAVGHGGTALLRSAARGTGSLGRGAGRLLAALAGGAGSVARASGDGLRRSAAVLARGAVAGIGLLVAATVWLGHTIARGAPVVRRAAAAAGDGATALAGILAALCVAAGRGIGDGARMLGRGAARGGGAAAKTGGSATAGATRAAGGLARGAGRVTGHATADATRAAGGLARSAGRTTAKAKPLIPEAAGAIGSGASAGASGARRLGGGVGSTARRSVPPLRSAAAAVVAAVAALGSGIGHAGRATAAGIARMAPRVGAGATAAGAGIAAAARTTGQAIAIATAAVVHALVIAARAVGRGGVIAASAIAAGTVVTARAASRGAAVSAEAGMRALRAIGAGGALAGAAIAAATLAVAGRVRSAARSGASAAGSVRAPKITPRRTETTTAGSVAVSRPPQVPTAALSSLRATEQPGPAVKPSATRAEPPAPAEVPTPAPQPAPRVETPPPRQADPPPRRAPAPPAPPPLRPSPVMATSSGGAGPSGPRWYRRLWHPWRIAGGLVALLLVAVLSFGVLKYLEIVNALHGANNRVSTTLRRQLAPAGPILSTSQVTLLMGISGTQKSGSISAVGLATQPQRRRISLLYMPRTVRLPAGGSPTLEDVFAQGGPPLVTKTLSTSLGVPINHVVELNFDKLGSIVNALGGITLFNPSSVSIPPKGNGQLGGTFHSGKLRLSGRDAAIYIRSGTSPEDADRSQAQRQSRVLGALVNRILALPATSAPTAASHILDNATSDLSANDLFGLIWFRFHAPVLTECRLSPSGIVTVAPGTPVGTFIAGGSNAACRLRHLAASPIALPATPQQLAVWLLVAPAAALLALIAVILTIVLVRRRGRRRPPAPATWQPAPPPFIPPAAAVAETPPAPAATNGRAAPAVSDPVPDVVSAAPGDAPRTPVERPTLPRLDILQTLPRTALLDLAEARDVRTDELPHMSRDAILAALIEDALHHPRRAAAAAEQNGHAEDEEPAPGAELPEGGQPAGTPTS